MTQNVLAKVNIALWTILAVAFFLPFCMGKNVYAAEVTDVFANNGYAYGKSLTTQPTLVAELKDGVRAQSIQWQESSSKTGSFTNISGANSLSYTFTPTTDQWYRCKVNGVSTIPVKMIQYLSGWYVTNESMAYTIDNTGNTYKFFNAVGMYDGNWQQTSYSNGWQMVTSNEAEPASQRWAYGAMSNEGNAKLEAFRVSFSEEEPAKLNVSVDLEQTQRSFSFGSDVKIGDNDSAPLNAVYKNGVVKQVQMVSASSRKDATDDTLSLVLDYVQTPNKYWLGAYGSRCFFGYNIYQNGYSQSQYPKKVTDQGTANVVAEVTGTDSGMTSSWMNLAEGASVSFQFNVGKVSDTGAVIGTDSEVTSNVITYKSLKSGYEYKLQTSTDGVNWTDVEDTGWVTPDAEGKLVYGESGIDGVTSDTTVSVGENTRYKLICRKVGSEKESDVAGGDVTTSIDPSKTEEDKPAVSAEESTDGIRFSNLRTEFQYALVDADGNLKAEYISPDEDGSLSFTGLYPGTDYYLVAKSTTNLTSDKVKYTTQKVYVTFEDNVAGEEIAVPAKQEKVYGKAMYLPYITSERTGYSFAGWTTISGGEDVEYSAGEGYEVEGDSTLYAVWKEDIKTSGNLSIDYTFSYRDEYNNLISGTVPKDARPDTVRIILVKTVNGESTEISTKEIPVTDSENSGSEVYDFGLLPQYENGKKINYSFRQDFSGLPSDYEMTEEENGDIHLSYNPSYFKIKWSVTTDFEKASRIIDAIRIQITYKNREEEEFQTILQHADTYLECFRQNDGSYSGEYSVWQYNQLTKNPYLYSLRVIAYKADGEWHETSKLLCVTTDSDQKPVYYNGTGASGEIHTVLEEKKSKIILDENYGESPKTTEFSKVVDVDYILSKDTPERTGYDFVSWNTKADGSGTNYAPGSVYQGKEDICFYAQWKKKEYTVVLPNTKENPGIEIKGDTTIKDGDDYIFTISGKSGYSVEDIVVKADGKVVDSKYMKYDKNTNTWTITIPGVSQPPAIEIGGVTDLKPEIQKETTVIQDAVKTVTPKNGVLFSDLKNLTDAQKKTYENRINAIVKQAEKQLQSAVSKQQIETIRKSAVSQINAIVKQAQTADKKEADKKKTVVKPAQKPVTAKKTAKDESGLSGNDLAKRNDLPILLAKGVGGNKKICLSWLKVKNTSGYEVYWSYCNGKSNFKLLNRSSKLKKTHKKLSNKKKYKYFVVSYRMVDGKKIYTAKSNQLHVSMSANKTTNAKAVKVKKTKITLKKGNKFTIKAKLVREDKEKKLLKHAAAYRYYSSNKKIAAVSKKGVIKAKKKGTCTLYVLANNGAYKKITVTVK